MTLPFHVARDRMRKHLTKSMTTKPPLHQHAGYAAFLGELKTRIRTAQIRAALSVNRELIQLYWDIGRAIILKQETVGWGTGIIDRLAADILKAFPGIEGFSTTNISRMRTFYLTWTSLLPISAQPVPNLPPANSAPLLRPKLSPAISAQLVPNLATTSPPPLVTEIPWGHNVVLIFKVDEPAQRIWYAQQTVKNGWSRSMLEHWIDGDLYHRQGKAVTNFKTALPPAQSDLAEQILKDPYNFDFLTLAPDALEKQLEDGLLEHITRFLVELGEGFAYVGRQVRLKVDGEDFYIDLLFYHLHLRAFIVIDLKAGKFEPAFAGQMNFHLSAVDDLLRKPGDAPTIGLILCRKHSKIIAEYALRHLQRPVGVAGYLTKLTANLPRELARKLPTVQQLEKELSAKNFPQPRPAKRKAH